MKKRYYALDVFRGSAVAFMILVNNPGTWQHIFAPLRHAEWHGLTPTDLVFPFFLFAVGNAMSFVMPRFKESGDLYFWKKISKRSLIIFAIGLFLNWLPFVRFENGTWNFIEWVNTGDTQKGVRIFGVLQRIAVCYFFASLIIYYFKRKTVLIISFLLLLIYWVISYFGNIADPYSMIGWIGTRIDQVIITTPHLGKLEKIPFEAQGFLSTLPAIVQIIFGYFVGDFIIKSMGKKGDDNNFSAYKMLTVLFVAGVIIIGVGYCWGWFLPINKKMWTSSFTLFTSGLAILILSVMIYFIEVRKKRNGLFKFFEVFGKNPLFIYAFSEFFVRIQPLFATAEGVTPFNFLYKKILINIPGKPEIGSLMFAIVYVIIMWLIAWFLDRKKIYIKV